MHSSSARRLAIINFFFFFSSRRRHTRCSRDWSSDVCSSDLDAVAWNAEQLVPLLTHLKSDDADVERARTQLVAWDKDMLRSSTAATIYFVWEEKALELLVGSKITGPLAAEYAARGGDVLVPALTHPGRPRVGPNAANDREALP